MDLTDGESVEMQGSGSKPYLLTNTGGVYSCTCPAWRNQSLPIEQRTCKHLRKLRGDAAEQERTGGALPVRTTKEQKKGPAILLAESWDNAEDLTDWWISEKLDGVRAYWDGKQFLSRQGNVFHAPEWFIEHLPEVPLDGELWLDRKAFQRTVSIVRRQDKSDHWQQIRYLVFDAPAYDGDFETRMEFLIDCLSVHAGKKKKAAQNTSYATAHEHTRCESLDHLQQELQRVEQLGGEGLMLRQPNSRYHAGRSSTLLKVKTFHDMDAVVTGYQNGRGKHKGKMGALEIELPDGTQLKVGTGFSDKQRAAPPELGSVITIRYQELTDRGVPRFPSFIRVRSDVAASGAATTAGKPKKTTARSKAAKPATGKKAKKSTKKSPRAVTAAVMPTETQYFEYVEGKSAKFWEIGRDGLNVTVRYGRIGSNGQTRVKSFPDEPAAQQHVQGMIEKKTAEGYTATEPE